MLFAFRPSNNKINYHTSWKILSILERYALTLNIFLKETGLPDEVNPSRTIS